MTERIVIAISGQHGSGKTTYAKAVARELGLRYVSAGDFFREIAKERGMSLEELNKLAERSDELDRMIDERTKKEAKKGGVVLDGLLAAWMAGDLADVKIYVKASDEERYRRLAKRDGLSFEEAKRQTKIREESERRRFKEYYGIDIDDLSIYDLVIDSTRLSKEACVKIILDFIEGLRWEHGHKHR